MSTIQSNRDVKRIVMDNDYVRMERVIVEKEVKADDFLSEMVKTRPFCSEPLPYNCAMVVRGAAGSGPGAEMRTLYILQLPAGMRKVIYRDEARTDEERRNPDKRLRDYTLSWPLTYWFALFRNKSFADVYLTAARESMFETGDWRKIKLSKLPMPNQYDNAGGKFCVGNSLRIDVAQPAHMQLNKLMEELLVRSAWNTDLPPSWYFGSDQASQSGIRSLLDWHNESAKDPNFHVRLKMHNHPADTIEGMIGYLGLQL